MTHNARDTEARDNEGLQATLAANATLTNGNFASNNPNAWETTSIIAITTPSNTAWSNVCKIGRIHLFTNMLN